VQGASTSNDQTFHRQENFAVRSNILTFCASLALQQPGAVRMQIQRHYDRLGIPLGENSGLPPGAAQASRCAIPGQPAKLLVVTLRPELRYRPLRNACVLVMSPDSTHRAAANSDPARDEHLLRQNRMAWSRRVGYLADANVRRRNALVFNADRPRSLHAEVIQAIVPRAIRGARTPRQWAEDVLGRLSLRSIRSQNASPLRSHQPSSAKH